MEKIVEGQSKLNDPKNQNKNSIVKDENGYYKVILGAVNTYNVHGLYYELPDPKVLFEKETILSRRLKNGLLRAEYEHPDFSNLTRDESIRRLIFIDVERVCGHIKKVEFYNTGKKEKGWDNPIYLTIGWIKPSGPNGKYLQEVLDNPDENATFSIRTIAREEYIGGITVRKILDISTWDYVFEPGIPVASQWEAVGIESITHNLINETAVCIDGTCIPKIKDAIESSGVLTKDDVDRYIEMYNEKESIIFNI